MIIFFKYLIQLSAGLNLETLYTILSGTFQIWADRLKFKPRLKFIKSASDPLSDVKNKKCKFPPKECFRVRCPNITNIYWYFSSTVLISGNCYTIKP